MVRKSFQETWQAYQQSVNSLYQAAPDVDAVDRGVGVISIAQVEQNSLEVLSTSGEVRSVLTEDLQTEDLSQRELATLKLLAAAAYDLTTASDLLAFEEEGPQAFAAAETDRSARLMPEDLREILDAPLEDGVIGLLAVERRAMPADPQAARLELQKSIADFLVTIPSDAASLGEASLGGVVNLGLGPAQAAASLAAQEILARVPQGVSLVVQRAAELVAEAINKLRAAIGEEQEKQVREQAAGWLKELQEKHDLVTSLLDRLYETQRIGEETIGLLATAPGALPAAQFNQATQSLDELMGRYAKTKKVLNSLMRVLSFVKTPIMAAAPWGPLSLYATYTGIMGYAVYSGGDYLDWYRTGQVVWLDRVKGLRTTVKVCLKPPPPPPGG